LDESTKYMRIAKDYADIWELLALDYDSQHYRLVCNRGLLDEFSTKYLTLRKIYIGIIFE
jgi:hypothetical protein